MTSTRGKLGRILLVEDHPVNQRVATIMLESLGFEVDVVANGADAVRSATSNEYHVILMDCEIPELDGYEATAAIRDAEGTTRHTPIVAVTASDEYSDRQRCLDAGMDDYLTKPLSTKTLQATLARWATRATMQAATPGAQPTGATDRPDVLDAEIISRLERLGRAGGIDLVGQLAGVFLTDADERIIALHAALAAKDCGAVRHAAHTLSGASASLGATDLADLCAALAAVAASGILTNGPQLLTKIEGELIRVADALPTPVGTP